MTLKSNKNQNYIDDVQFIRRLLDEAEKKPSRFIDRDAHWKEIKERLQRDGYLSN